MAGTCITTIKLLGASSLGLLTGSLTYQSIQSIPLLINQLNTKVSINSSEALSNVSLIINWTRLTSIITGGLSVGFLWVAYAYSRPKDQHPYIVYSAVSAPLAICSIYYKAYKYESKLLKKTKQTLPVVGNDDLKKEQKLAKQQEQEEVADGVSTGDEESQLGKSYIHVSDEESSSATSTPGSSVPGSPKQTTVGELDRQLTIEEEVENALYKKEYINDLQHVKVGYLVGSSIAGLGFFMVTVGMIGDTFFL